MHNQDIPSNFNKISLGQETLRSSRNIKRTYPEREYENSRRAIIENRDLYLPDQKDEIDHEFLANDNIIDMTTDTRSPTPQPVKLDMDAQNKELKYKLGLAVFSSDEQMVREYAAKLSECESRYRRGDRSVGFRNRSHNNSIVAKNHNRSGSKEQGRSAPGTLRDIKSMIESEPANNCSRLNTREKDSSIKSLYQNFNYGVNSIYNRIWKKCV